jgi:hypothetical protein
MYVYTLALEAAAPTVFLVWLWAFTLCSVYDFSDYVLRTSSGWLNFIHVDVEFCYNEDAFNTILLNAG